MTTGRTPCARRVLFRRRLLIVLGMVAASHAAAETKGCTVITALPYEITVPGRYCLQQDLTHTGTHATGAIRILADDVTLDCNGHVLTGTAGANSVAIGVSSHYHVGGTVRGCHVQGFGYGISVNGRGWLVEDNLVEGNARMGIDVASAGGVIRRNRVLDIGGATAGTGQAVGIQTTGRVDVLDNTVAGVHAGMGSGGKAYGVYAYAHPDYAAKAVSVIDGNRIRRVQADGAGESLGILMQGARSSIHDNRLSNPGTAGVGLRCTGVAASVASANHVNGFAKGLQGCHDGGDNTVAVVP